MHQTPDNWVENIQLSQETFFYICQEIAPFFHKEDELRVTALTFFLSGSTDYQTVTNIFGLEKSVVSRIVHSTCQAIVQKLMKQTVYLQCNGKVSNIVKDFEDLSDFPQVVAALNGCHIRNQSLCL